MVKQAKAWLSENFFETKEFAGGLVVVLFVVVGSQMAVYGLFLDWRCLSAGWGQSVTTQRHQPS